MNAQTKIRWLSATVGVCLVAMASLGYYAWTAKHEMDMFQAKSEAVLAEPALSLTDPKSGTVDPFIDPQMHLRNFSDLQKRMDEMMNRAFTGQPFFNHKDFDSVFGAGTLSPEVSVTESPDEYQVTVRVPQGQAIDLNTEISGNLLEISGDLKNSTESNTGNVIQKSYSSSHFSQTLSLSEPVIESAMKTEHKGDNIIIHIPKQKNS